MRKCIVLNNLDLTQRKKEILDTFILEYLKAVDSNCLWLPDADSSIDLHHLTYSNIRKTSSLASDIVVEARKDTWKMRRVFESKGWSGKLYQKNCCIRLNRKWFKFIKSERGNPCFKITYSPKKTFAIPIRTDKQFQRFNSFLEEGWVFDNISLLKDGKIAVVLEKEFKEPKNNRRYVLGIDIGSATLATATIFDTKTSKIIRQLYFGCDVALGQRRYLKRRGKLRKLANKGSYQAKKSLERLKHKQFNFVKTRSGQIVKEIINLAMSYNANIAIEKLKNIRTRRGQFNKKANRKINRIPYGKFKEFLKSNCEMLQVPLHEVDAYHTSKWCSCCGAVNRGHQSGNYALYKCKECGMVVNSDRKASLAVAVKSVLERNSHSLTTMSSFQISKTQVPVNGLLRPSEVGLSQVTV